MSEKRTTKPKTVNYWRVPDALWEQVKQLLPEESGRGRPRADARAVLNGIWFVLWTGCQWKAVRREWFGVCSSSLHRYFQQWQEAGVFAKMMRVLGECDGEQAGIG